MSLEIEKLRAEQETCALRAHAAGALAEEKELIAKNVVEKLFGHMQDSLQEIPEMMELALAEAVVDASQKELELEGKELLADVKLLEKVQNQLQNAEAEKVQLEEALQKAKEHQQSVQTELESSRAVLKNLTGLLTFASKEEAERELESVNEAKMQADEAYAKGSEADGAGATDAGSGAGAGTPLSGGTPEAGGSAEAAPDGIQGIVDGT